MRISLVFFAVAMVSASLIVADDTVDESKLIQKFEFAIGTRQFRIASFDGRVYCFCWEERVPDFHRQNCKFNHPLKAKKMRISLEAQLNEARQLAGGWLIPYWSIVVPLTVLSVICPIPKRSNPHSSDPTLFSKASQCLNISKRFSPANTKPLSA